MAEIDVKNTQGQTSEQEKQAQSSQSGSLQTTRSGQPGGGLARRGAYFPSVFSLSPRDLFSASPFELMRRFTEEMDRVFENFGLARGFGGGQTALWSPVVDVFQREGNLIVHAELPGLNKDDVKVEITDDGLVIRGESKSEHEERGEGFYRCERSHGQFYRLIPLPADADLDQARAQFNNGVLEVSVPVPEAQRRWREIPIQTGGEQAQAATTGQSKS